MLIVVPVEESSRPLARRFEALKASRVIRPVLHRLELRLGKGIVIGRMRPGVTLAHTKVNQQLSNRFGDHRRTAIGVQSQLFLGRYATTLRKAPIELPVLSAYACFMRRKLIMKLC